VAGQNKTGGKLKCSSQFLFHSGGSPSQKLLIVLREKKVIELKMKKEKEEKKEKKEIRQNKEAPSPLSDMR